MRRPLLQARCERDLKRMEGRGKDRERFLAVVRLIARDGRLGRQYRPHKLSGEWEGYWECHIESNWLILYKITDKEVLLARTGTHADLFE